MTEVYAVIESPTTAHGQALVRPRVSPHALLAIIERFLIEERRIHRTNVLAHIESRGTRDLGQAFKAQGAAFLRRLGAVADHLPGTLSWEPMFHEAVFETRRLFELAAQRIHEGGLSLGVQIAAGDLNVGVNSEAATQDEHGADQVSFSLHDPAAIEFLRTQGAALVTNVDAATRRGLADLIAAGTANGDSYATIAGAITDRYAEFSLERAQVIAVHEAAIAYSAGQMRVGSELQAAGVVMLKSWVTAGDDRVDLDCESNEADGAIPLGDSFASGDSEPPAHVGCLPGHSDVAPGGRVTAASERWFDGDVVVITTARGHVLTCTPNHPVLTREGFVAAGTLDIGDDVISHARREPFSWLNDDHQHMPSLIAEVADALRRSPEVLAREVEVAAEDFHGDGVGSEVAVVWADGELGDRGEAPLVEQPRQSGLVGARVGASELSSEGDAAAFLDARDAAPGGIVGRGDLTSAHIGSHAGPLESFGLGAAPRLYTGIEQACSDGAPIDLQTLGAGQLGLAGEVSPDEVVDVQRQAFRGHIYNLSTMAGWYIAEGLIVQNCRCDLAIEPDQSALGL